MNRLQKEVDKLIKEFGGYWKPFEMLAAVVEELGELSDEMLKLEKVKGKGDVKTLEEEFGDLLFSLFCIANYYGIDVERALLNSIAKYRNRDRFRWGIS